MHFVIINGPNLNLLGIREQGIYGSESFESYLAQLQQQFPQHKLDYFQSNVEGEIINQLHQSGFNCDGIILNAGGYTHTSVAIGDAVKAIKSPLIEVHISNIFSRENFRHHSFIAAHAKGIIAGLGLQGYELALRALGA